MTTALRPDLEALPPRLRSLRIDARGYPVPWFVAWVDGPDGPETIPEFRAMDARKWRLAVTDKRCWVCGEKLGGWLAFPLGPMCAITRTIAEPPSHRECAEWSIRNCPFLSNPAMVRRVDDMPDAAVEPGGQALNRNPGVICLWITGSYEVWNDGRGKPLITVGAPVAVTWWCQGRSATRAEVEASVESGLPALMASAQQQGRFAVEALGRSYERARVLFPAAAVTESPF